MSRCEVCGNDYDLAFEVRTQGSVHVFDSFECAISRLAPICEHCQIKIVGHGVEGSGRFFCCAHCARAVEGEQGAEVVGRHGGHHDQRRGASARMHAVLGQDMGFVLVADPLAGVMQRFFERSAAQQRRPLGQAVGDQQAVVVQVEVVGTGADNEVDRRAGRILVQPLEEGVLAVGARHAPDGRPGGHAGRAAVARGDLAQ